MEIVTMLSNKTTRISLLKLLILFLSLNFLFSCETKPLPNNADSIEISRANAKARADYIADGCPNPEDNFPEDVLTTDLAQYGLDAEQWNNIMRIISKYEQDDASCNAWTTKYTYCADIDDDRGITFGIYGATTGTFDSSTDPEPDGPDLFASVAHHAGVSPPNATNGLIYLGLNTYASVQQNQDGNDYIDVTNPQAFCNQISHGLNNQQLSTYEYAQWSTFSDVYIMPVFDVFLDLSAGIGTPALFAAFIDTALNEGEDGFDNILDRMDCSQYTCTTPLGYSAQFSLARKMNVDNPDYQFNQPKNGCLRTSTWYNFSAQAPTLSGTEANLVFITHVVPIALWGPYENPPIIGTACNYNTPGE